MSAESSVPPAPTAFGGFEREAAAKTDNRRNSVLSASVRRSKLQSISARSVCCRGSAVRSPPESRRKRSRSRSAMFSTESARTRAAASSSASGIPSSRWQIVATAPALRSVTANVGRAAVARSTKRRTASPRSNSSTGTRFAGSGSASGASGIGCFAAQVEMFAARRHHLHARARFEQRAREFRARLCLVLAVVEDHEQLAVAHVLDERLQHRARRPLRARPAAPPAPAARGADRPPAPARRTRRRRE